MKMMSAVVLAALVSSVASSLITVKLVCRSCPPSVCETTAVKDPGPALPADQVAAMDARLNDCRRNVDQIFDHIQQQGSSWGGNYAEVPEWSGAWPALSEEEQARMTLRLGLAELGKEKGEKSRAYWSARRQKAQPEVKTEPPAEK